MKHAEAYPSIDTLDALKSEDELTPEQRHLVDTARRWCEATTAADHIAIYGSSARDYSEWHERQDRSDVSLVQEDSTL